MTYGQLAAARQIAIRLAQRHPCAASTAIVTIRKPGKGYVPDMMPEEHQRRGDAAEALFREMKRRIRRHQAAVHNGA
jgi:hypothetical protein